MIKNIKEFIYRVRNYTEAILISEKSYIIKEFKRRTGNELNLHNPKTFSEKIQWLKLNYRPTDFTIMADKYEVRNYVENKIGNQYLIPLHTVFRHYKEINYKSLPHSFALKATHGSGWNIISRDKNKANIEEIRKYFKKYLRKSYYRYSKEWSYKNIKPRILCEHLIIDEDNNLPKDYKIFCFNGKPFYTQVDFDRFEKHTRAFYDNNWAKQDFSIGYPLSEKLLEKPENFNKMLEIASELSNKHPLVRVDLYNIQGRIYFGELTLYPGNGMETFSNVKWDVKMGNLINYPLLK